MNKTKEKILLAARELFNCNGLENTNLRTIAKHIGISQGNLNYHFKKREDILEALYFEMVAIFDARIQSTVNEEISLEIIFNESKSSMFKMFEYRFIWIDLHQIIRSNPRIEAHFLHAKDKRLAGLAYVLSALQKKNKLRAEEFEYEFTHLAKRIINFGDYWLSSSIISDKENTKEKIATIHRSYFEQFYPYLTAAGKSEFLVLSRQ